MPKKIILIAAGAVLLLGGGGAGLYFSGMLGSLLGGKQEAAQSADAQTPATPAPRQPVFFDMPEVVANLNSPGRRSAFIKLKVKLELSRPEDAAAVHAAMPRILDLFQTYLREIRPDELRGSVGTHRLREELIVRGNIAAAPARITDVLFVEMLVQ